LFLFSKSSAFLREFLMPISGHAKLAGVIGWPVSHSRSPRLHNFWLARHGIDGAYVPLPAAPADFAIAVRGLRAAGFRGANVTIPHKAAAFAICDTVDEMARRAGAVNTLVFGLDGIAGSNTDGAGFIANLRAHGVNPGAGPALLLGAGGAARAIAASLLALGVRVSIANRSPERAAALAEALPDLHILAWDQRDAALADHALLVNTTSLGMHGAPKMDLDLARAPVGMAVADIVYVPLTTPLLADAAARGLRAVGGLGMLLHQAVPGFAAWFGVTPVVDQEVTGLLAADIPPQ
jgi:shikimate dehydrogenase